MGSAARYGRASKKGLWQSRRALSTSLGGGSLRTAAATARLVETTLFQKTFSASSDSGLTHTAAIATRSPAMSAAMLPVATASVMPTATPACAAPQVRLPCRSSAIVALLTNSVSGLTGRLGRSTVTNGAWPGPWLAIAWAKDGPSTDISPMTTLTCAASAPSPVYASPIRIPNVVMDCTASPWGSVVDSQRTLSVSRADLTG